MRELSRRALIAGAASATAVLGAPALIGRAADPKQILLAEPVHLFAYIPVYLAGGDAGLYAKRGLEVKYLNATGGAHVAALASGQVWGNIGGAESDAMTNTSNRPDPLFAIVNIVNRALVYFSARKGLAPKSQSTADMKEFFKGKKCAFSRYGGTPDVLARTYVESIGLDPKTDITIINNANIGDAPTMIKSGAADIAVSTEPQIAFGIEQGIWDDPNFLSFSTMGEYAFACVSVRKSTITGDAATTQAFVDSIVEALKLIATNKSAVEASLKKQFPNLSETVVRKALDRCYKDNLFSKDGVLSTAGYDKDMESVYKSGEMTRRVPYSEAVDMSFVSIANEPEVAPAHPVNDPVIVAGAGPVGCSAALALAQAGIPVVLLERETVLPEDLRASTIHPSSLDMLATLGVTERIIPLGLPAPVYQYRDRQTGDRVDFDLGVLARDTPFPMRLQCEQFKLTRVIVEMLKAYPHATVRLGATVTGLEPDESGVSLAVAASGGASETVRGSYVIGCDGGTSTIRKASGIDFEGFTYPEKFLSIGSPIDYTRYLPGLANVTYVSDPDEWCALVRVVGSWRVVFRWKPKRATRNS